MENARENIDIQRRYAEAGLKYYTPLEEALNAFTHGVGVPIALAFMIYLLCNAKTPPEIMTAVFMCSAAATVYGISAVYHALKPSGRKFVARKIDHASVGLLVTASAIPFLLLGKTSIYNYVAIGACLTVVAVDAVGCYVNLLKFKKAGVFCDLVIAAIGFAFFFVNRESIPDVTAYLYAAGFCCCLLGLLPFALKAKYMHTVFHVLTLLGPILFMIAAVFMFA